MSARARAFLAVVYGGVILAPLVWMFARSFDTAGAQALTEALARAGDQDLLANSIWLALLTTLIAVALGAPLAWLVSLRRFPGRAWIGRLYWIPLLIPPHIHAIAWARVTGDRGWLTAWLKDTFDVALNIRAPLGDPAGHPILGHLYLGPAWVMACAFFPLVTLSLSAGLRSLDPEGLDAARLCGRPALAAWRIVLPLVAPRLLAGALFVFLLALSTYPVVSLLDTPTLIQRVFFTFAQVDQGAGALLAMPLVLVAAGTVTLLTIAGHRAVVTQAAQRPVEPRPGGGFSLLGAVLILALASGVPLGSLLYHAGPLNLSGQGPVDNYQSVFGRVSDAFGHSLLITVAATAVLVLLSYPVGRVLARRSGTALEILGLSLLAFPPVVVGVALVLFWSDAAHGRLPGWFLGGAVGLLAALAIGRRRPCWRDAATVVGAVAAFAGVALALKASGVVRSVYEEGISLVVLALVTLGFPFTVRLFRNGFAALDPEADEAARLAGHGLLSRTLRVELPRLGSVVVGAAVMGYVLGFTELAASLMTLRPGWQSVQVRIFNMVHYQSIGEVAALCVLVVLLAALPVVLLGLFARRRWEVL